MNTITDQELLARHLSGHDPAALRELMARHAPMVYATARRLAPSDAEDVTQAVFLLLWQKAGKLKGMSSVAGWLYRATRYACRNANKVRGRREHYEREAAMLRKELTEAAEPQVRALLDEGLSRLGETNRQAVLLRYLEGLSAEETAGRLGMTPTAAAKRAERGVEKLRAFLGSRGYGAAAASLAGAMAIEAAHGMPPAVLAGLEQLVGGGLAGGNVASLAAATAKGMIMAKVQMAAMIVLGVLAVGIWAVAAGSGTRPASRPVAAGGGLPATMAATGDPVSVERLMAILQTREDQLRNFAYSLRESTCVIDAKGTESLKEHRDVELRRKDGKSLLHSRHSNDTRPEQPPTDALMLWDGKAMRQIVAPATPQQHPQGLIGGAEPDALRDIAYNHMLGYRVLGDFSIDMKLRKAVANHSTMTQWLTRMVKEKVPMTVEVDQADRTLMVLKVRSRVGDQVAWFDPQRGHMLVCFEYRAPGGAGVDRSDVLESRQIAGIWVPIKVVRVSSSTRWPEKTQWIYEVKDLQVGVVKDDELKLEFAEGTDVIDTASTPWSAFRVRHTGRETLDLEKELHRNSH